MRRAKFMMLTAGLVAGFLFFLHIGEQVSSLFNIPPSRAEQHLTSQEDNTEKKLVIPQKELKDAFNSVQVQLVEEPAPMIDFTLENLQGKKISTKDSRGKFLWINFWATWCPPCRGEMPSMQEVWERFGGENFSLLAVDLREDERTVRSFVEDSGYTFPVLLDKTGQIGRTYRVRAIPTSYFVDPGGKVIGVAIGAREWTNEKFYKLMQKVSEGPQA